jgi:hypothetical protein
MRAARPLIRLGFKPPDAIHLATAAWAHTSLGRIVEVNTYDTDWAKRAKSTEQYLEALLICEPHVDQMALPFDT